MVKMLTVVLVLGLLSVGSVYLIQEYKTPQIVAEDYDNTRDSTIERMIAFTPDFDEKTKISRAYVDRITLGGDNK